MIEGGHGRSIIGTKDPGAVGNGQTERNMVVIIARKVLEILNSKKELKNVLVQGVGVETEANLNAKVKYVNSVIAENRFTPSEVFSVSLHMNSVFSKKPRGFEIWYCKGAKPNRITISEYLVRAWQKYAILPLRPKTMQPTSLHHRKALYIDNYRCPAVLVEIGFISNTEDVKAITQDYNRAAEAIAHGILEFVRST
jgi:N-acetylmuramoyl-L-alanine amidase